MVGGLASELTVCGCGWWAKADVGSRERAAQLRPLLSSAAFKSTRIGLPSPSSRPPRPPMTTAGEVRHSCPPTTTPPVLLPAIHVLLTGCDCCITRLIEFYSAHQVVHSVGQFLFTFPPSLASHAFHPWLPPYWSFPPCWRCDREPHSPIFHFTPPPPHSPPSSETILPSH